MIKPVISIIEIVKNEPIAITARGIKYSVTLYKSSPRNTANNIYVIINETHIEASEILYASLIL